MNRIVCVAFVAGLVGPALGTAARGAEADDGPWIRARFVSAAGWVRPGQDYVFSVRYGGDTASGTSIEVALPPSARFLESFPPAASGDGGPANPLRYDAAGGNRIVVRARAASLDEDPELIWKDLSAEATLIAGGRKAASSRTNGPRATELETARYGDRPFPVANVQYADVRHCTAAGDPSGYCTAAHSARGLDEAINSKTSGDSVWQLYHDMSLGQLDIDAAVPAAALPSTVPFAGEHPAWSRPDPHGFCAGTTRAGLEGTPLYANRIEDGWYTLPGTQAYYGSDAGGDFWLSVAAGFPLFGVDGGCGPGSKLAYDAAAIADPDIDYNDFDTDRDGVVDFFEVVYAGDIDDPVTYELNAWPHSSDLRYGHRDAFGQTGYVSHDQLRDFLERPLWFTDATRTTTTTADTGPALKVPVRVGRYNINPERAQETTSIIAHEYGHSLGLPDFYSLFGRSTFEWWELMAYDASQFMSVFSRQDLGWIVPLEAEDAVYTMRESKIDTHEITWRRPDGTPYTLSGPGVHNADSLRVGLPPRSLIDDVPSGTHAWHSGSGDAFGCPVGGGHGLLVRVPEAGLHKDADSMRLTFASNYEIEWDYDYGFVLASGDGGQSWSSLPSGNGTTISKTFNPNAMGCLDTWDNGITGVSGRPNTATNLERAQGEYAKPEWISDSYDLSGFVGSDEVWLLFAYSTDESLAKRGWFVDDVRVSATTGDRDDVLYASDFEQDAESLRLGAQGSAGWARVSSDDALPADHAYYVELRDRVGWDLDGKGHGRILPIGWEPGLSVLYTDEAHGYGNCCVADPPPQTVVDAVPEPGNDFPGLANAAFTASPGRNLFDACTHIDNYTDPDGPDGTWKMPGGVRLLVDSVTGLGTGDARAVVKADVGPDCSAPSPAAPVVSLGSDYASPDPDGAYTLAWTRPAGATGPDELQEASDLRTLLSDGAEAGMGNWTVSTSGVGAFEWEPSSQKRAGGEHAFWSRGLEGAINAESIMEWRDGIAIPPAGTTTLTFADWYTGEGDDAARVEIFDGSKWTEVCCGPRTLYMLPGAIDVAEAATLAARSVDLTPYAGRTVRLRFRLSLGPENRPYTTPMFGWYVDDVSVTTADWKTIATTPDTSVALSGRADGTYHYRVRSTYPFGSASTIPGPFSDAVRADVRRTG